jgi:hypothetical protein
MSTLMNDIDLNNALALIEEKCGFGVARSIEGHIRWLEKDARRYRFMREHGSEFVVLDDDGHLLAVEALDSTIDAALKEGA